VKQHSLLNKVDGVYLERNCLGGESEPKNGK